MLAVAAGQKSGLSFSTMYSSTSWVRKIRAKSMSPRPGSAKSKARLGTGKDALVRVELRDKTRLEGYISEAGADAFAVTGADGKTTTVAYPQVRRAQGNNLSTGAKIAIGIGIGVAVTLVVLYAIYAANER